MAEIDDLIQRVTSYASAPEAETMLTAAYEIAERVHDGFQRLNGDSTLSHVLAVAGILAEWHAPPPVIATALLHDVHSPDYSHGCDLNEVEERLGTEISRTLKVTIGLNDFIRQIERHFDREGDATTNIHHMMLIMQEEPDAVIIKLADRIHNLRTFAALSRHHQERLARIGFHLLAPLAEKLGMDMVKRQFEDYSFEIINPTEYQKMAQQYEKAYLETEIHRVGDELRQAFVAQGSEFEVRWQKYSLYFLYGHQIEQNVKHNPSRRGQPRQMQWFDTGAFIVLTTHELECYQALGLVHKCYPPVKGQFRDWIAAGKENGYRALHTQVRPDSAHTLHISIRTRDMNTVDEYGVMARWWNVPETLLPQRLQTSAMTGDALQVFTPESEIKHLPHGATVLDFAYSIHTEVGHRCAGALVNGQQADIYEHLCNGDRIEIIQGGEDVHPHLNWLDHVCTPQAMGAIRQWLVQHQRKTMYERGRSLLTQQLRLLGLSISDPQVSELLGRIAAREAAGSQDELLAAIGTGRLDVHKIIDQLKSARTEAAHPLGHSAASLNVRAMSSDDARLMPVLALCCRPAPFDEIAGLRNGEQLIVHKRTCSQVRGQESPVLVGWDTGPLEPHYMVVVEAVNRPGLAHDLAAIFAQAGLDMDSFNASRRPNSVIAEAYAYLGKTTAAQRERVQKALEAIPHVTHVEVIHSSLVEPVPAQSLTSSTYRPNPYGPGVAKGERFYGRAPELERITSYLCDQTQNRAILLWGQRRIGKTSLVVHLQERAQGRFLPVYIDMQSVKDGTNTQFLHLLMKQISQVLRDHEITQDITAPALNRLRKDPLGYFDNYLSQIERLPSHEPLAVILDEFECLTGLREEGVSRNAIFSRLRSQSLHGQGVHLVLSGGGLLNELIEHTGITALFNITHDEKLSMLEPEAARQLIRNGLMEVGGIVDGAVEFLFDLTAGHPYYLQLLCSDLFEHFQERRIKITRDIVRTHVHAWLEKTDNSRFQHFWEGYDENGTRRNKLILSAIADLRGKNDAVEYANLHEVIGHIVPGHQLVRTLEDLTNLGVLKHEHSRYTISVNLFAQWLRQHWPLTNTLKEGGWA